MKPAYKLQEFVAHTSNVNCLKIGKKSSRVLVTGGEDHKVNIWAIGKPNAILCLSGHSNAVESVAFDAAEVLVLAGAASGTIKLWDLEEAKIVRTLTGHRSNCISVDFHPFGEFFASGSLDTNLKIWDIRRKGCIHTYKGHTRGINAIKFSPDGRWVATGGEDNTVKLWDLTAGKLMHDFKHHDGQIMCLDFHPHEFLLATGSADRTVKFCDLETFESVGSAGPEAGVVRSLIFNPDGRTLLCGLHESLKVFSWEPIRCHDVVDVSWSKLADLSVHEGKLLGCSFSQSCVGIWVVDLLRVGSVSDAGNAHSDFSCCKSVESVIQPVNRATDASLKSGSAIENTLQCTPESSLNEMKLSGGGLVHLERYTILQEPSRGYSGNGNLRTIASNYEMKEKNFGVNVAHMIGMRASLQGAASFLKKGNQNTMELPEDSNVINELTQQHDTFLYMMQYRLAKLQAVRRFWIKNDTKGAVETLRKMTDNAVLVDVLSVLIDRSEVFTLEICTLLLPLLNGLLNSDVDRYLTITLAVLSLLVKSFGSIIHTTRIASPSFGVDLHAEQRLERCNSCFCELQNVAQSLIPVSRKGGEIGRAAQDLSIALQEI